MHEGVRQRTSPLLVYGAAVLAPAAATLLRIALTPLIGPTEVPFITYFPAVLFTAWHGGFRPSLVSIVLSVMAANFYFIPPLHTFWIEGTAHYVTLLVFLVVGIGMASLGHSQRKAVEREREQRRRFETTLASIGDAVISTDAAGRIDFANKVALSLLRSKEGLSGKPLDEVFRVIDEDTRTPVESPVAKVLSEGTVAGLANHSLLIAQDGAEIPIDDSAAPIHGKDGTVVGTVLVFRDISARRRAEQTSRRLASIVQSSDDAIIAKDLNGVITSWNTGAERMFGYTADEAIGQPVSILAAPDRNEMPQILERVRRGERVDHYETVRRTKSGDLLHVSLTVSPMRNAGGQIIGASKIVRDISQRVRAAEELARLHEEVRKARDLLRTTLSSIGDAVISTDAEGRIVFANPVAVSILHLPEKEILGRHLDEVFRIVNEFTRAAVESPVARVLREGAIVGLANHTVLITHDGAEVPIDDSGAPIFSEDGSIQGTVLVFRDVTGRRDAENALRESEQRFRNLSDSAPVMIWESGLDKKCTWFNRAWLEFTGRTMEQELGDGWAEGVHPEDLERCIGIYAGSFERRETFRMEYRLRRHDGQWRWVLEHSLPRMTRDGTFLGFLGSCIDITESKDAEQTLRNTNEALQEYADILDPAAVLVRDIGDRIIRWTSGAQALYGITAAEAIGRVSHDLFRTLFPEPLEQIRARLFALGRWEGELRHRKPDGHEVIVASVWALHRDRQGLPVAILEVNSDITERKRAEEKIPPGGGSRAQRHDHGERRGEDRAHQFANRKALRV